MHTVATISIGILSHNIRYATKNLFDGEAPWSTRLPLLASHFIYHSAHIGASFLCLQEVLHNQLLDLCSSLNDTSTSLQSRVPEGPDLAARQLHDVTALAWDYVGVGRNDGKQAGEYAPIFYRPHVWELLHSDTLWLSETPDVPGSKGWDAGSPRILTICVFRHRHSGKDVVVLNTHLDDQGIAARREAAKMITHQTRIWTQKGFHVVLAGDLNSSPTDEAYLTLTSRNGPFVDTRECVRSENRYGDDMTFTGFKGREEDKQRIDYLLVGPKGRVKEDNDGAAVIQYAVLPNRFDGGVYQSDHRAVVAVVELS